MSERETISCSTAWVSPCDGSDFRGTDTSTQILNRVLDLPTASTCWKPSARDIPIVNAHTWNSTGPSNSWWLIRNIAHTNWSFSSTITPAALSFTKAEQTPWE